MTEKDQDDSNGEDEMSSKRPLGRNAACHQCRKRKLKCDGLHPVCSNCLKPRARLAPNRPPPPCTWDDSAQPVKRKSADVEQGSNGQRKARLVELEERVAAFERMLGEKEEKDGSSAPSRQATVTDAGPAEWAQLSATATRIVQQDTFGEATYSDPSPGTFSHGSIAGLVNEGAITGDPKLDFDLSGTFGLAWPDWPRDLPCFEVVEHVVNHFFEKIPTFPKMLHKGRFMSSLHLPPGHDDFPAVCLIHGILALTAPILPESSLANRAYWPIATAPEATQHPEHDFEIRTTTNHSYNLMGGKLYVDSTNQVQPTPLGRFQFWHRRKSFAAVSRHFDSGKKILQALQAQLITTHVDVMNAWWVDAWMEAGTCVRMAVPMRLNECAFPPESLDRWNHAVMPPPKTPIEMSEAHRTWWITYLVDRNCGFSTGWTESLNHEEIHVELPVTQQLFDSSSGGLIGSQTLHSKDFYSTHPEEHRDSFNFLIKATALFSDVNRFFRNYGRGSHSTSRYLNDPTLRLLLSQINSFRLSLPSHLRRPTQRSPGMNNKALDGDMLAAIMITHGAALSLGDPMVTKDTWNTDVAKIALSGNRAILSLIYDITATSYDLTLLPGCCATMMVLVGKSLCRFIDAAVQGGDLVSASVFRSECEVIRLALQQYSEKWPVSARQLKFIDLILDKQEKENDYGPKDGFNCTVEDLFDRQKWEREWRASVLNGSQAGEQPKTTGSTPSSTVVTECYSVGASTAQGSAPIPDKSSAPSQQSQRSSPASNLMYKAFQAKDPRPSQAFVEAQSAQWMDQMATASSNPASRLNPDLMAQSISQQQPQTPMAMFSNEFQFGSSSGIPPIQDMTMNDLGINPADWFEITNLAFDVDALAQQAALAGWTFDGADSAFKPF